MAKIDLTVQAVKQRKRKLHIRFGSDGITGKVQGIQCEAYMPAKYITINVGEDQYEVCVEKLVKQLVKKIKAQEDEKPGKHWRAYEANKKKLTGKKRGKTTSASQ